MNNDLKDKINILKRRQDIIKSRIRRLTALNKSKSRKEDTRRKILVGAFFLEKALKDNTMHDIISAMDSFLSRYSDRILFGLQSVNLTKAEISQERKKSKNKR